MTCPNCGVSALGGDRYCDECGSALPITAVLILEESGWRVPLPDREQVIIGRRDQYSGEQPDVDLEPYNAESHGISRRHVRIEQSQSRYLLEDLESVNLTYVNDQRLEAGRQIELQDRDRIVMGSLNMMIRLF